MHSVKKIRDRVLSQDTADGPFLPPERNCNIDCWNSTSIRYFDIEGLDAVCHDCKAEGCVRENKDNDLQLQNVHFARLCCNKGKCVLPLFPPIPGRLREMCTSRPNGANHFQNNIRLFNCGLSMASGQVKDRTVRSHGPAAFKVMGQLFRRVGPMLASENSRDPRCMQSYFCDPEFRANHKALRSSTSTIQRKELLVMIRIFICYKKYSS